MLVCMSDLLSIIIRDVVILVLLYRKIDLSLESINRSKRFEYEEIIQGHLTTKQFGISRKNIVFMCIVHILSSQSISNQLLDLVDITISPPNGPYLYVFSYI